MIRRKSMNRLYRVPIITALAAAFGMTAGVAVAGPGVGAGPSFTLGGTAHPHAPGMARNPAAAAVRPGVRDFGLIGVGVGFELGQVDALVDELDDLLDALDDGFTTVADALEARDRFNDFLEEAGKEGYIKVGGTVIAPPTPLVIGLPDRDDALTLDFRVEGQARLGILDAPVVIDGTGLGLETDTSLYVQDATIHILSLGYARPLHRLSAAWSDTGRLVVGGRLRMIQGELSQTVIPLQGLDDDVSDAFSDAIRDDPKATTRLGVDIGAMWVDRLWRAGATATNLNEPSLDYQIIGKDCDDFDGDAKTRCEAAAAFADRVDLNGSYTMERQLQLEGAVHTPDQIWILAASVDANAVPDAFGDDYQWATASASVAPERRWIPAVRFGYRANLSGTKIRYVTTGMTLFSVVDIDLAYALDGIEHEGEDYPRSLVFTLGAGVSF